MADVRQGSLQVKPPGMSCREAGYVALAEACCVLAAYDERQVCVRHAAQSMVSACDGLLLDATP